MMTNERSCEVCDCNRTAEPFTFDFEGRRVTVWICREHQERNARQEIVITRRTDAGCFEVREVPPDAIR
jgi:hypothetical protein